MNADLVQKFIDTLVGDTLHDHLRWHYLKDVNEDILRHYGNILSFEIFAHEVCQINERHSYVCLANAGLVYLVYFTHYPSNGSGSFDRFELYLHADPYKPDGYIDLRPEKESELYRLENAVRRKVVKDVISNDLFSAHANQRNST